VHIHRSHPAEGYVIIPNDTLRDPRLSYEARGVLAEILTRPDDWHTTADELAATARKQRGGQGEGRRKIRAAFAEIEAAGYLRRNRFQGPDGRMTHEIHVYDTPQADDTTGGTPVAAPRTTRVVRRCHLRKHKKPQVAPTYRPPAYHPGGRL
jgi:hypothetical protein